MNTPATGQYLRVAEGVYLEGLAVDHQRNLIWYSDVIAGGVHAVTPEGKTVFSLNPGRMWTGGIMLNSDGSVLSSGQGGIMWNHPESGNSGWLLQELEGQPINGINEMWPDGRGGIFFGTNDIEKVIEAQPTRPTSLYRLTAKREVIKLADNINFSNGIAFDRERRRFYCSDTFNTAWAWDVSDDLSLTGRHKLLHKEDCDGLALFADGTVLLTGFRSPGVITCVNPDGIEQAPLPTPPGCTTQIRFGGADAMDYYINIVPADGGDSLKDGKPLSGGSYLYRGRAAKPGVLVEPANFVLR